jgi:hypothetical protein
MASALRSSPPRPPSPAGAPAGSGAAWRPSPTSTPRCTRCGIVFDRTQWDDLTLVERIGADTLQRMVLNWPRNAFVEIRRCTCGHPMARTDVRRRVRAV